MNNAEKQVIRIVRCILNNEHPEEKTYEWDGIVRVAGKHNLLPFIKRFTDKYSKQIHVPSQVLSALTDRTDVYMVQNMFQNNELKRIRDCFEAAGIRWIPLKGSVTKKRYPDEFLRTMGDIDFLYQPEQHSEVKAAMQSLGYDDYQEGRKNDTYKKKPWLLIEAHRELVPAGSDFAEYCSHAWERAVLNKSSKCMYEMTLEDEFVFNIIHLAIHFLEGGAGIRFITDVYVYHQLPMKMDYIRTELDKVGLLSFHETINSLAEYWFGNGEETELIKETESFILSGNVFGSKSTKTALAASEGKIHYLLRVCFPNYREMKSMFPWLSGKPYLLPYAWGYRAYRSLKYRRNSVKGQFKTASSGDAERGKAIQEFYSKCGLNSKL